jgi:hypothetical protein
MIIRLQQDAEAMGEIVVSVIYEARAWHPLNLPQGECLKVAS